MGLSKQEEIGEVMALKARKLRDMLVEHDEKGERQKRKARMMSASNGHSKDPESHAAKESSP